jgi:hypothetical protein
MKCGTGRRIRRRRVRCRCLRAMGRHVYETAHLVRFGVSLEARYTEPR